MKRVEKGISSLSLPKLKRLPKIGDGGVIFAKEEEATTEDAEGEPEQLDYDIGDLFEITEEEGRETESAPPEEIEGEEEGRSEEEEGEEGRSEEEGEEGKHEYAEELIYEGRAKDIHDDIIATIKRFTGDINIPDDIRLDYDELYGKMKVDTSTQKEITHEELLEKFRGSYENDEIGFTSALYSAIGELLTHPKEFTFDIDGQLYSCKNTWNKKGVHCTFDDLKTSGGTAVHMNYKYGDGNVTTNTRSNESKKLIYEMYKPLKQKLKVMDEIKALISKKVYGMAKQPPREAWPEAKQEIRQKETMQKEATQRKKTEEKKPKEAKPKTEDKPREDKPKEDEPIPYPITASMTMKKPRKQCKPRKP